MEGELLSAVRFHLLVLRRVPSSVIHLHSTLRLLTRKVPTVGDTCVRVRVMVGEGEGEGVSDIIATESEAYQPEGLEESAGTRLTVRACQNEPVDRVD